MSDTTKSATVQSCHRTISRCAIQKNIIIIIVITCESRLTKLRDLFSNAPGVLANTGRCICRLTVLLDLLINDPRVLTD